MQKKELLTKLADIETLDKKEFRNKEDRKIINDFFQKYIKKECIDEEMQKLLGEEKYSKLVVNIKSINQDYYDFKDAILTVGDGILDIYENCFIVFDFDTFNKYKKQIGESKLISLLNILTNTTLYCIDNDYSSKMLGDLLSNRYDCPQNIRDIVISSFEKNRLQLMLSRTMSLLKKK